MKNKLMVGASKAEIKFTEEMLPNVGEEYTHIHDNPYVQVMIIESGKRFVIASFGLVGVSNGDIIKENISKICGTEKDNVIVHSKHVLSTPHTGGRPGEDPIAGMIKRAKMMGHKVINEEEAKVYLERDNKLCAAIIDAGNKAAEEAVKNIQPAKVGFGLGYSETNVNRVVYTNKGWWQGNNPDGVTDRTVPVLRFDSINGEPIAIMFNCNTAPGSLENSFFADGRRAISGDISGASEAFIDGQYKNVVSMWTTGATGDQWQALRALFETIDREGNQVITDLGEDGFILVDILGKRLGQQVVKTADSIETSELSSDIHFDVFEGTYPAQKVSVRESAGATTDCEYTPDGETTAGYAIMQIGDVAIVLCGVEMGVRSYAEIKEKSPFAHTFVIEFTSVGAGGGYMVEKDLYEKMCYQSRKSRYAAGSAELFREDVIKALNEVKTKYAE